MKLTCEQACDPRPVCCLLLNVHVTVSLAPALLRAPSVMCMANHFTKSSIWYAIYLPTPPLPAFRPPAAPSSLTLLLTHFA